MDDFDRHYRLQAICFKDKKQCIHSSKICQYPFFRCKKGINPLDHALIRPGNIITGECPDYEIEIVEDSEPVVKLNKKPKSILDLF